MCSIGAGEEKTEAGLGVFGGRGTRTGGNWWVGIVRLDEIQKAQREASLVEVTVICVEWNSIMQLFRRGFQI